MPFQDIIGHNGPKEKLRAALRREQIGHAYLFIGEEAIGKRLIAIRLAQALNCEGAGEGVPSDACGLCRSCRQIEAGTHPDVFFIGPSQEQANPSIKIDRIREIENQVIYRPLIGARKVCIINEADRLTLGAANALLKTLEEPPAHCLFILVTNKPFALPITVRSRCLTLKFSPPTQAQVEGALTLKNALPQDDARFIAMVTSCHIGQALQSDVQELRAQQQEFLGLLSDQKLRSVSELLDTAETLSKSGRVPEALTWLSYGFRDLLLLSVGANPLYLFHQHQLPSLQNIVQRTNPDALLEILEDLLSLKQAISRNLNLQLGLENMLLRLREVVTPPNNRTVSRQA